MIIGIDCSRAFVTEKTGTENYSYHLVTQILQLPEAQSHTFVLFTRPNAVIPDQLKKSNVVIHPIKLRYLWTQLGLAMMTWRKFEIRNSKFELDVLWVPAHTLPVLRNPGVRTVVTIHGLEYQWLPEYKNWLQRWYLPLSTFYAAASADQLIAVSAFTRDQLVKELHTSAQKIKVIQEGVDGGASRSLNLDSRKILEAYGLQDKKYLLFVGTVQPRKNVVALIEAFSHLPEDYAAYKLVIAGGIGWMAESVLSAPGKLGVQEKVIFTGRISDLELAALYSSALIYVQPSLTEGFGLPVLEAMGWGVPVITSNGGALSETAGTAAIVVGLGEGFASRLSRAIAQLIDDAAKRRQLIDSGKKRVSTLSWVKAAQTTFRVLIK